MIVVAGQFRFPAENLDLARAAMAAVIAGSRAEEGCLRYAFSHDVQDPCVFHVSEAWTDRPAFDAHMTQPHFADWRASAGSLGLHDRDATIYEAEAVQTL
ncbi:putative quinol monooxygenase [Novosphingobium colocasiae]|uniref:putative quinol monooxygenase n=1 Tax=Novosphingobium colocasiae TaxID=1256513 RepID=UPI0035AF5E82